MRKAVVLLALIAAPASAQNSDTNCYRIGAAVNCHTQTQSNSVADFWNNYNRQQAEQADRRERERELQQQQQFQQQMLAQQAQQQSGSALRTDDTDSRLSQEVHSAVGKYLKEGKCQQAINFALEWGEVELANQAKTFCAKPDSPAAP